VVAAHRTERQSWKLLQADKGAVRHSTCDESAPEILSSASTGRKLPDHRRL
jgi:hypothetical protein